jgi:hypothetical protein
VAGNYAKHADASNRSVGRVREPTRTNNVQRSRPRCVDPCHQVVSRAQRAANPGTRCWLNTRVVPGHLATNVSTQPRRTRRHAEHAPTHGPETMLAGHDDSLVPSPQIDKPPDLSMLSASHPLRGGLDTAGRRRRDRVVVVARRVIPDASFGRRSAARDGVVEHPIGGAKEGEAQTLVSVEVSVNRASFHRFSVPSPGYLSETDSSSYRGDLPGG